MRKSLLGLVLAATLLPFATAHAAPAGATGKAKSSYNKATKNAKEAIAAGIAAGLTIEEAMTELLEVDGANAADIISAAVSAAPTQAGAITSFAINKGVSKTVAVQAAVAAAPTQAQNIVNTVNNQVGNTGGVLSLSSTGTSFSVTLTNGSTTTSVGGGGGCGRASCS
jgi:hypothetical protein